MVKQAHHRHSHCLHLLVFAAGRGGLSIGILGATIKLARSFYTHLECRFVTLCRNTCNADYLLII